jgi:hypothetical protein
MQQRAGGPIRHAPIAIGHACYDIFLQAQHAAHARNPVQGCDEMHLTRAGVGETHINPATYECMDQAFRTIHCRLSTWRYGAQPAPSDGFGQDVGLALQ